MLQMSSKLVTQAVSVLPVIHYSTDELAERNAEIAFAYECAGVFVISMEGNDDAVPAVARRLKARYPDKIIGINLLRSPASKTLTISLEHGLDATWTDSPGVRSDHLSRDAMTVRERLEYHSNHLFFGSVAFKYQVSDPNPGLAAAMAATLGMIPTTSGAGTGIAAPIEKIASMRQALGQGRLAIASGITPANVLVYLPFVTHILVATGISADEHALSEEKLASLMERVQNSQSTCRIAPRHRADATS